MTDPTLKWNRCSTLSKQIVHEQPAAKEFLWAADLDGNIHIKSRRTSQVFSREDYQAMISHVSATRGGVPLGARHDDKVPENSVGALMERRRGTQSIRGWCSHIAAIAVEQNQLDFIDMGRGPGRGIYLYAKKLTVNDQMTSRSRGSTLDSER